MDQLRASGGYLAHWVWPSGTNKAGIALCGFRPRAVRHSGRKMTLRHGWYEGRAGALRVCTGCDKAYAAMEAP